MRTKFLITIMALLALGTQSYASTARLVALGMDELDDEGLYYIEDQRNIFLNPANVNSYGDMAILEFGGSGSSSSGALGSNATLNQDSESKAQGGVLKRVGEHVFGIYYGNESDTSSLLRILSSSEGAYLANYANAGTPTNTTTIVGALLGSNIGGGSGTAANRALLDTSDNQLDVFYGRKISGMDFGANAVVYLNKNEQNYSGYENDAYAIRLGLKTEDWQFHFNTSLKSDTKMQETISGTVINHEFAGSLGIHVGGSYNWKNSTFFGFYKTFKWDQKDDYDYGTDALGVGAAQELTLRTAILGFTAVAGGQNGTVEGEFNTIHFGWSHQWELSSSARLWTTAFLKNQKITASYTEQNELNKTVVPLTVAFEADANDWLTFRGSITQNLYGVQKNYYPNVNTAAALLASGLFGASSDVKGKKQTVPNSTRVDAGATLNFGKLTVDGLIGNQSTGTKTGDGEKIGFLRFDNFYTRVAMNYYF